MVVAADSARNMGINFEINGKKWPVFIVRPETIFGVTFVMVSAQHPRLNELVTKEQKKEVDDFLKKIKSTSEKDAIELEKEGAFTGSYAINPVTKDKVPVYTGNFVVADYGSGMVMAVPAHDQRDFEFAVKYKIPIKQVIAPLWTTSEGIDGLRKDLPTIERDAVFGIVKHWKEDKYFCLEWPKFGWKSIVIGGIEKGETPEEAVAREVKEETGYQDIKKITPFGFETHGHFFARHKNVNRYARYKPFLVELGSDKYEKPAAKHVKNHDGCWVEKEKVAKFLNIGNFQYVWDIYSNGERAFTGEGVLINSDKFSGLDSEKAAEEISAFIGENTVRKSAEPAR